MVSFQTARKMLTAFLVLLSISSSWAETNDSSPASAVESVPDADAATAAEFRQGGGLIGQQLYPGSSIYGASGYQQLIGSGASAGSSGGYSGMLRQLYRPSSFGLTDKVRNWVKSFLNRRQYVKPYYNPGALLAYNGGTEDKPIYINGASYKPVSVPLRQIQKYYKPFYGGSPSSATSGESGAAQYFVGSQPVVSPGFSGFGSDSGLYGSENSPSVPVFSGGSAGNIFSSVGGPFGSNGGSPNGYVSGAAGAFSPSAGGHYQPSGLYGTSGGNSFSSSGVYGSNSGSSGMYGSVLPSGGSSEDLASSSSSLSTGNGGSMYIQPGGGRNNDGSFSGSTGELQSGYAFDSSAGNYPVESTYSLSYQRPPQSPQSYGAGAFEKSSFQPVNFGGSDGSSFKSLSSGGQSSSSSALFVPEKNS